MSESEQGAPMGAAAEGRETWEGPMRIAAKLYEARDTCRTLLGDKYEARMAEWADVIRARMRLSNTGELNAARELCELIWEGIAQVQILAAAVEMLEPSVATPTHPRP
jgi:hypothetical protein